MTKKIEDSNTPEWLIEGSKEILESLGYDLSKDIHEQFINRHFEQLQNTKKPKRGRPKKSLPIKKN